MKHAVFLAPFDECADPAFLAELASDAEHAGWDGLFLWDHVVYRAPVREVADPWIAMAAQAVATERIRLGPMVTPLARRRPQVLARQTASLDNLSKGRLVFGVGLGLDQSGRELSSFGEELDDRTRAEMLDESLEVITELWSGERVHHRGAHYRAEDVAFLPPPLQQPRVPIWVAARWPYRRPLRRAARWDGLFVIDTDGPQDLARALQVVREERGTLDGFDVACEGGMHDDPGPWQQAGATWWLVEPPSTARAAVTTAVRAGPPGS